MGWPVSGLGQPVVRTCHTRMNCPKQRETGPEIRTPSVDPSLEDELLHCTPSSQKPGSTTLGAQVPRNQDGETKLQLFLPTWQVENGLMAGLSWKEGIIKPANIQRISCSVLSSPAYLYLPPPFVDISWMIIPTGHFQSQRFCSSPQIKVCTSLHSNNYQNKLQSV